MYLTQTVVSFTYINPVAGASSNICWMCPVCFHFPIGHIKVPFCDVVGIIAYYHSALSWPPSILAVNSKDLLCGYVIAFGSSVFSRIPYAVVMPENQYALANIWKCLIKLSSFWVNFIVLVIISISNLSSSLWVGSIGGVIMHECTTSLHIPYHNIDTHPLVTNPPYFT